MDLHRPATDDVMQELRRIGDLLERLVSDSEERREGERQMEQLGAMLAGGDSQAGEMPDQELVDAHFHMADGSYGINEPDGTQRPASADESRRLEQLVGRKRRTR